MIDFSKHTEEEKNFMVYLGGRLSELRRQRKVPQSKIAKRLRTGTSSIHDLEYGYRWISAWDLKAYADICGADIGSLYEGIDSECLLRLNPDFIKLDAKNREIVNKMISFLCEQMEEER